VGRAGLGAAFVVRHGYFGLLFVAAAIWFGTTVSLHRPKNERRRRCALLRADLRGTRGTFGIATLVGANLGFFAVTQVVEGIPVAAGALGLSLVIALAGSLATALVVFSFGRAIAAAAMDSVIGRASRWRSPRIVARRAHVAAAPRHAAATYSLLRPNRPPPISSQF
jgi:uncharacterized membrane protein YedE/YeeE